MLADIALVFAGGMTACGILLWHTGYGMWLVGGGVAMMLYVLYADGRGDANAR